MSVCTSTFGAIRIPNWRQKAFRVQENWVRITTRIGDSADGTVVSVKPFGVFVELESPFVDGLVSAQSLPSGPWTFDRDRESFVPPRRGRSIRVGDRVRVEVAAVSVARRQTDFLWVGFQPTR